MSDIVLILGGGELSSGIAYRLARAGIRVVLTELAEPLAVRRLVSFSEAVYSGTITVEGIEGVRAAGPSGVEGALAAGKVPVLVDPQAEIRNAVRPAVIIDGRMTKLAPDLRMGDADLVIGLGPGFTAGDNCHAVIETKRGHFLGHVYWEGSAEPDSGLPDTVGSRTEERVLRAPASGRFNAFVEIGQSLMEGQRIAEVSGNVLHAPFNGLLRGLLHPGIEISVGVKAGDIDPRMDPRLCDHISDKALAVGGAALEAVLTLPEVRNHLWD